MTKSQNKKARIRRLRRMKILLRIREKIPPQTRPKAPLRLFLVTAQIALKIPQQIL